MATTVRRNRCSVITLGALLSCAMLCCVGLCNVGVAQEPRGTWQDAVRLIDSSSSADIVAAIAKLNATSSSQHTIALPPGALTTLAMFQLRQHDYNAAAQTLKRLNSEYTPTQLQPRRGAILRITLLVALSLEDATTADAAFKDLVRMVASGQVDPIDLKLNAMLIGTTVGMLGVDRAKSPLSARVLTIGQDQMMTSKLRGVGVNFQAAFENSRERTDTLLANLIRIDKEGIDAVVADLEQRQQVLKQRAEELQQQKELTGEVIRNTREQVDQNTQDIRQLAKEINNVNFKLRQPTPGHPGPKRLPPPPPPSRYSIAVDEYESQTDYEYVTQNGQSVRVPVTRQVRRNQIDIDRDRDRIHRRLQDQYDRAMTEYRTYDAEYNTRLTSWIGEDQRRRQELTDEKAELEVKRSDLIAANKAINEDKKDSAKDLRAKRTETEQEEFEVELLEIAANAFRDGKPHSAFRPIHFESLYWSQEKILLQKP